MTRVANRLLTVCASPTPPAIAGIAQDKPATSTTNDPRVGLKGGFRDAGQAARGVELVATMPRPAGFYDPKAPAGSISAPRGNRGGRAGDAGAPSGATAPAAAAPPPAAPEAAAPATPAVPTPPRPAP